MATPTDVGISQEYGWTEFAKNGAYGGGIHNGMDFRLNYQPWGSPANFLTILSTAWDNSGFGNLVRGRDEYGFTHWFAHNSTFLVSAGQVLAFRQNFAISGNTGFSTAAHGHWSVQQIGATGYNGFINPRNWPGFAADQGGGSNVMTRAEHDQLVDEIFRRVLGIPSDAAAREQRKDQTREQIIADLFNSQSYVDLATAGMVDVSGTSLSPAEIKAHAKAQEPVPQLIYNWAKDRYKSNDSATKLEQIEKIIHGGG